MIKSDGCKPAVFVEIVITGVYPGNAIVWLLKQLLNTRHGCVEHIGDVLRPFVFVRTTFGNFKDAGFSQIQQIFAGTPLRIKTSFGNLIRNRIISRTTARSRTMSA